MAVIIGTAIMSECRPGASIPSIMHWGLTGALARLPDGRLALPKAGRPAPTTHILKVPRAAEFRLVDHEMLLLDVARAVQDHPVARAEIVGEGDARGLLVERFDREVSAEGAVSRLHQEDFAQAMGLHPRLRYERDAASPERAFTARAMGRLIEETEAPGTARLALLGATLVNLALSNTDNHAKNHALLHHGPRPVLAPLYDIVPVLLDREVNHDFAFRLGRATRIEDLTRADVEAFATDLGMRRLPLGPRSFVHRLIERLAGQVEEMLGPVRKAVGDMMADQLTRMVEALYLDVTVPERDFFPR